MPPGASRTRPRSPLGAIHHLHAPRYRKNRQRTVKSVHVAVKDASRRRRFPPRCFSRSRRLIGSLAAEMAPRSSGKQRVIRYRRSVADAFFTTLAARQLVLLPSGDSPDRLMLPDWSMGDAFAVSYQRTFIEKQPTVREEFMTPAVVDIDAPQGWPLELYTRILATFYVEERTKIFVRQGKYSFHASSRGHEVYTALEAARQVESSMRLDRGGRSAIYRSA